MTRCYPILINCGLSRSWLLLVLLCFFANSAYAVTVTSTPGTCTTVTGIGTLAWTNPGNATVSDTLYATAKVNGSTSNYLQCTNYGFAIPTANVTINGITVNVTRKTSSTSRSKLTKDAAMRLVKAGAIGTTDRSTTTSYTTTLVTQAHGSATDLWGQSWTAADINAANFGTAFAAVRSGSASGTAPTTSVNVISVTVDYTLTDTTPPTVASIALASGSPTGTSTVAWTVVFSESVTGVDASDFIRVIGSGLTGTSIASVSGSGTTYTVTVNTGSGSGTLGLNLVDDDSIRDLFSNKLGGTGTTGAAIGSFTGAVYAIDKVNPTVTSMNLAASNPSLASSVSWTVVITESVTGVDVADFSLAQANGVSGASISSVTGSGTTYTVTASTGSGSGTLGLNLVDNDTIVDSTSHPVGGAGLGNANFTGQLYTIDKTIPSVTSIDRADVDPTSADVVSWTVIFSESVTGLDTSDFTVVATGVTGAYVVSVSGRGNSWTVIASTGICVSACTLGLNLVDDDSIADLAGNKMGGNGNGNFTGQIYTITSTPPLDSYSMEEASWNGTDDEVTDSYGGNNGTAYNGATTTTGNTGTCRYGVFSNGGGVLLPGFTDLTTNFTISAWIRTTDNTRSGQRIFVDDANNTGGYGLSLGDGGTGTLRFYTRGSRVVSLDTSNVIANNSWYFVAGVADISNGMRYLYVYNASGTLLTSVSVASTGWGVDVGDASIGSETIVSGEAGPSFSFYGNLDEVQVYGKVLNSTALASLAQSTHSCAASYPHHIEIVHATGTGVTCAPSTLTLRACADADCSSLYTGGISGTLTAATTGTANWDGGSPNFTISQTGSVTKTLQLTSANSTVSAVLGTTSAAINPTTCTFAGCIFTAANSGFTFDIPDHVAATTQTLSIHAVQKATNSNSCVFGLSGANQARSVQISCAYQSPLSGTLPVRVNGIALNPTNNASSACASAKAINLTFDSTGTATATIDYADVGKINMSAVYIGSVATGDAGLSINGADSFIAAPKDFAFSGVTSGPIKAGSSFSATVTARNNSGATTPNFGKESEPESVALSFVKYQPTGVGTVNGAFSGSVGAFSNGVATSSNLSWSEVGKIDLSATLTSASYLGSDLTATGSTGATGAVGRFIPDHFDTTVTYNAVSKAFMPCPSGLVCPASGDLVYGNGFVYSGEAFTARVTARNLLGNTTVNYDGTSGYAKGVTLSSYNAVGGLTVNPGGGGLSLNTILSAVFNQGVAITSTPVYTVPVTPATPIDIFIRALDTDNVTSLQAVSSSSVEGGIKIVSGRVYISNAYGSELLDLPMTATVQYYNGINWLASSTDNVTNLTLSLSNYLNLSGGAWTTTPVPAGDQVSAGVFSFNLSKPTGGGTGSVDVGISVPDYLLTGSNVAHVSPSNTARATFGIYKGNSHFIYFRELF